MLMPNRVRTIWPNEPVATPNSAPVTKYAISTKKLATTTKKTIPMAFAWMLSSPYPM